MIEKLYQKLLPYAQWKYVLIGLVFMVFINVVAFPFFGSKLKTLEPNAMGPLDLKFSYTPEEAYLVVQSYGEQGREIAMISTLGVDVLYPIIYTLTTILLLIILFKKAFPNKKVHRWVFLPLVTFFADIFENTGIVLMLKIFPERLDTVASMTSIFSSVKWTFVGFGMLLIIFLVLKILFTKNKI